MSKKLFIIEDDANLAAALLAKFSTEGLVSSSHNGIGEISEVINIIETDKPDFIILDLILPQIDGFDLLSSIKSNNDISSIPLAIFTRLNDKDSKEKCKNLGADFYINKNNLSIDEFILKIKKVINNLEKS